MIYLAAISCMSYLPPGVINLNGNKTANLIFISNAKSKYIKKLYIMLNKFVYRSGVDYIISYYRVTNEQLQ